MKAVSSERTAGPWGFGRTGDEKIMILGEGGMGRYVCHIQIHQIPRNLGRFDEPERKANAAFILTACNQHEALVAENMALREALSNCQKALAMMVVPTAIGTSSVMHAFTQAFAAENNARAALSTNQTSGDGK